MYWAHLKKNRNWALWLSGFFGAGALTNLGLAFLGQPITAFGVTLDRNLYVLRFAVHGFIAYLLLHYWGMAQERKRKR